MSRSLSLFGAALLTAALVAPALAQPGAVRVHDPFHEGGRFTVQNLNLGGQGNMLVIPEGGRVSATLDVNHDCRGCGAAVNQVIVGLAGEPRAQACIWSGGARSGGWQSTRFSLAVPDEPGVYEVRVRYAQARSCRDAAAWWRTDRPHGPGAASTIGVIVVEGHAAPAPREARIILREMDRVTGALAANAQDIAANARQARRVERLARAASALAGELGELQAELREAMSPSARPAPRPRVRRPEIIRVGPAPVVAPEPMAPGDFRRFVQRVEQATFSSAMKTAVSDALHAGAYLTTGQAVALLGKFAHDSDKVDVAALVCPHIVEPGALPELLAAFTFESYRQELRERTGNVCGWQP